MKKISFITFIFLSVTFFNSCESKDDEGINAISDINYVSFESDQYAFGVDPDGTNTREIGVFASSISNSAREYFVQVIEDETTLDAAAYTVPTSVNIPADSNIGAMSITIDDLNIGDEGKTLVIEFVSADGLFTSAKISLNVAIVCPTNEVVLSIIFDAYSSETSWDIKDATNTIVESGSYGSGETSAEGKFCLDSGDYTFTIYDVYADGICCTYGNGSYSLTNGAGVTYASGGEFGASETTPFTLGN